MRCYKDFRGVWRYGAFDAIQWLWQSKRKGASLTEFKIAVSLLSLEGIDCIGERI